uniref:Uncharacterized protein n=2 Tax=Ixodes scapularis TaxID=6945 RepID=A0A1S4LAT2_IXOSC
AKRQKARVARKASCFSFRTRLFPSLSLPPETQQQNVSSSMLCGATLRRCCSRQTLLARRAEIYRAGPLSREGAKMAVCAHTFPPFASFAIQRGVGSEGGEEETSSGGGCLFDDASGV